MRKRCYKHIHRGGHTSSIWRPTSLLKPWRYFQVQKHYQYAVDDDDKDYIYETYHTIRFLWSYLKADFLAFLHSFKIDPELQARLGSQMGAIAFGADVTDQQVVQNPSFTGPTVSGSDTVGVLFLSRGADDYTYTSSTGGGSPMTDVQVNFADSASSTRINSSLIVAPGSGATIQANTSASKTYTSWAGYYTGCAQTGQPDASRTIDNTSAATEHTNSLTTVADNCWVLLSDVNQAGNTGETAGTGVTDRGAFSTNYLIGDSNTAVTPAGAYSMTVTGQSNKRSWIMLSLAPVAAGGWAHKVDAVSTPAKVSGSSTPAKVSGV